MVCWPWPWWVFLLPTLSGLGFSYSKNKVTTSICNDFVWDTHTTSKRHYSSLQQPQLSCSSGTKHKLMSPNSGTLCLPPRLDMWSTTLDTFRTGLLCLEGTRKTVLGPPQSRPGKGIEFQFPFQYRLQGFGFRVSTRKGIKWISSYFF
jgi:hypothetical protein